MLYEWRHDLGQWDCFLPVRIGGQNVEARVRPNHIGADRPDCWTYMRLRDQARNLRHRVQLALALGQTVYTEIGGVAIPIDFDVRFKAPRALQMFCRKK